MRLAMEAIKVPNPPRFVPISSTLPSSERPDSRIAAGKVLMKDRVLVNIDEEAENAHILEAAKKLWGDLNHRVY